MTNPANDADSSTLQYNGASLLKRFYPEISGDKCYVTIPYFDLTLRQKNILDASDGEYDVGVVPHKRYAARASGCDFEFGVEQLLDSAYRTSNQPAQWVVIRSLEISDTSEDVFKVRRIESDLLRNDSEKKRNLWSYPRGLGQPPDQRSRTETGIRPLEVDVILWHSVYGCFVFECKRNPEHRDKGIEQSKRNLHFFDLIGASQVPVYSGVVLPQQPCPDSPVECRYDVAGIEKVGRHFVVNVSCVEHPRSTEVQRFKCSSLLEDIVRACTTDDAARSCCSSTTSLELLQALVALRSYVYFGRDVPSLLCLDSVDRQQAFRAVDRTVHTQYFSRSMIKFNANSECYLTKQQLDCVGGEKKQQIIVGYPGTGKTVVMQQKVVQLARQLTERRIVVITAENNCKQYERALKQSGVLDYVKFVRFITKLTYGEDANFKSQVSDALRGANHVFIDEIQYMFSAIDGDFATLAKGRPNSLYTWFTLGPTFNDGFGSQPSGGNVYVLESLNFSVTKLDEALRYTAELCIAFNKFMQNTLKFYSESLSVGLPKPNRVHGPKPVEVTVETVDEAGEKLVEQLNLYKQLAGDFTGVWLFILGELWVTTQPLLDSNQIPWCEWSADEPSADNKIQVYCLNHRSDLSLKDAIFASLECTAVFYLKKRFVLNGNERRDFLNGETRSRSYSCVITVDN